ncbi:MAG: tetratricopeptide repeat protein [Candidatus Obscuribacterales bacterium]|nr:tetratricopeptide repeat protein [Candidatus Obscuribacterales bacterium]
MDETGILREPPLMKEHGRRSVNFTPKVHQSAEVSPSGRLIGPRSMSMWLSLSMSLAFCLGTEPPAQAARKAVKTYDYTSDETGKPREQIYRKRVIVAPTGHEVPRRIDYQGITTRDSLLLPNHLPNQAFGQFDSSAANRSRDGITPPPPPVKTSLLPKSIAPLPQAETAEAHKMAISPRSTVQDHVKLTNARLLQIKTEAQTLFKHGKMAEAQALLEKYVAEYPKESSLKAELSKVSLGRAKAHAQKGDHAQAAKHARLAVSHADTVSPELSQAAGQALDNSIAKLGVDPKNAAQRSTLGDKLSAQNRHMEAAVEYKVAARLAPSEAAHIKTGDASIKAGNLPQARTAYQSALELNPDSSAALRKLGVALYHMHDYAGASADLTRALVINPNDGEAASNLINLWKEQVHSRPSDPNSHLGMARAYQVAGDLSAAHQEYKKVVQLNPNHPHLPAARQSFKYALAKQEAGKAFQEAHNLEARGNLTSAYLKATDAVGLMPSEKSYQDYRGSLAEKLRAQGQLLPPVQSISPQAMTQIEALSQAGEQPPALNLPTAQAIGLAQPQTAGQPLTPFAHENGYRPISTDNHVESLAGFLNSMRAFTVAQQAQISKATDEVRQNLKAAADNFTNPFNGNGPGAGNGSGAGIAASGEMPGVNGGATGASDSGSGLGIPGSVSTPSLSTPSVSKSSMGAIAGAVAPFLTGANLNTGAGAGVGAGAGAGAGGGAGAGAGGDSGTATGGTTANQALLSAAKALANTGLLPTITKAAPSKELGSTMTINPQTTSARNSGVAPAFSPRIASGNSPTPINSAMAPNQTMFSNQAALTNQALTMNPPAVPNFATQSMTNLPIMSTPNAPNMTNMPTLSSSVPPLSAQPMASFADTNMTYIPAAPLTSIPNMMPAPSNAQPMQTAGFDGGLPLRPSMTAPTNIAMAPAESNKRSALPMMAFNNGQPAPKLLLTGVKAGKSEVQLKVTLKNEGNADLKLPSSTTASIREGNNISTQSAKVNFSSKKIPAGGSITGTIKIPGTSLSPSADIFIPANNLGDNRLSDLHLSVQ